MVKASFFVSPKKAPRALEKDQSRRLTLRRVNAKGVRLAILIINPKCDNFEIRLRLGEVSRAFPYSAGVLLQIQFAGFPHFHVISGRRSQDVLTTWKPCCFLYHLKSTLPLTGGKCTPEVSWGSTDERYSFTERNHTVMSLTNTSTSIFNLIYTVLPIVNRFYMMS